MPDLLTTEQALALAPDMSGARAAQDLSSPRKWQNLGTDHTTIWGECQGSGKSPYTASVDLADIAFKCSCPSRKFPCKHGLGLLLAFTSEPTAFMSQAPPSWVTDWIANRASRAKAKEPAETEPIPGLISESKSPRSVRREARAAAGIDELRLWLQDLVRLGLADVQGRGYTFWDRITERMVDAQVPGAARYLKEMAAAAHSGEAWQSRLLLKLARLNLLIEGFENSTSLPDDTVSDVRTALGFPADKSQLLENGNGVRIWAVVGQRVVEEDRLRAQRTWLYDMESTNHALFIQYAHGQLPFDTNISPGTMFAAELVYYPSAEPTRTFFTAPPGSPKALMALPGKASISEVYKNFSTGVTRQPWIERVAAILGNVELVAVRDNWQVRDAEHNILNIDEKFGSIWKLVALTGGRPFDLCGEWDGEYLWPLAFSGFGKVVPL